MSRPILESLPLLVLELVCVYLARSDPRRRSLFAFSLVSKSCCAAADRERFKRIVLDFDSTENFKNALRKWDQVLGENSRKHVRQMKVLDSLAYEGQDVRHGSREYWRRYYLDERKRRGIKEKEQTGEVGYDDKIPLSGDYDMFLEPPSPNIALSYLDSEPGQNDKDTLDRLWMPLSAFITTLPGLKDFVWLSSDQIPVSVWSALQLTNVRLHIHTFRLRSLYRQVEPPLSIDPNEYLIATSSKLTTITAMCTKNSASIQPEYDFNQEVVLKMVAQAAPNLRDLRMEVQSSSMVGEDICCAFRPSPEFFRMEDERLQFACGSKGHLRSLSLARGGPICPSCLRRWTEHTHFEELRQLRITLSFEALQTLTELAQNNSLENLHHLFLEVHWGPDQNMHEALGLLLSTLKPLQTLVLGSSFDDTVWHTLLHHHGASLQQLVANYIIPSSEQVRQLARSCPNLREITFEIRRTGGDKDEVDIYRSLGKMPRLKRASLTLNCWVNDPNPPISVVHSGNEIYTDDERMHFIKLALVNSAVDADLACAIFSIIQETQATVQSAPVTPFDYLKLNTNSAGRIGEEMYCEDFDKLTRALGRSWVCSRDVRDTHRDEVHVREIDKLFRVYNKDWLNHSLQELDRGQLYSKVWKEIWPESTGHWVDDWHSLPLELTESESPTPKILTEGVRKGWEKYPRLRRARGIIHM